MTSIAGKGVDVDHMGSSARLNSRTALVLACLVVAGSGALFAVIMLQDVTSVGALTRDPTVTAEEPWYLGFASSLGVIGWAIATGSFITTAVLLYGRTDPRWMVFGGAAAITLLLTVDDVFLLHDDTLLRLVGSELPIYTAYLLLGATWFGLSFRSLDPTSLALFFTAGAFLGTSVLIDLTWNSQADIRLATEDGLKFAGIWIWVLFAVASCVAAIDRSIDGN